MKEEKFDLVVIGGGPGGYVAAIRAAQLGLSVACVDKMPALGGTCLNIGCIPSKALLRSTELLWQARSDLESHGINASGIDVDLDAMMRHKDRVVEGLTQGVESLFKKNGVQRIKGHARLDGGGKVVVSRPGSDAAARLAADAIILATGSAPVSPPGIDIDEQRIVSSTGALSLPEIPERLVVIGGGYIGLEMGSVWRRLGTEVACVEMLDQVLPGADGDIRDAARKALTDQGFDFRLHSKVSEVKPAAGGLDVLVQNVDGNGTERLSCDVVLVAVGRRPVTEGLGLEDVGVAVDDKGFIKTDPRLQTSIDGIYAIGDVIGEPMLAHKAEDEGMACVETIAGRPGHVNYDAIPAVVYTAPEIASVGKTEDQLKHQGIDYRAGTFPFRANSRARCVAETEGFVKILADRQTDLVLGGHVIGPDAGTLIHEIVAAIEFGASAEELARMCHGHPTLNEAVREAAFAVGKRAIHI